MSKKNTKKFHKVKSQKNLIKCSIKYKKIKKNKKNLKIKKTQEK